MPPWRRERISGRNHRLRTSARTALVTTAIITALGATAPAQGSDSGINKINHVVVVYQENWSFDSLYGHFPGANGYGKGDPAQVKLDGSKYDGIPQAIDNNATPSKPDARIPTGLTVQPFDLTQYIKPSDTTGDIVHRY